MTAYGAVHELPKSIDAGVRLKPPDNHDIWGNSVVVAESGFKVRILRSGTGESSQVTVLLEAGEDGLISRSDLFYLPSPRRQMSELAERGPDVVAYDVLELFAGHLARQPLVRDLFSKPLHDSFRDGNAGFVGIIGIRGNTLSLVNRTQLSNAT
jgi:hypothetical protein